MRKRWKWLTALVAIVVIAAGLVWFLDSGMRIDHRRYRAIRFGTTKTEVEKKVLGAPPGDYGTRKGRLESENHYHKGYAIHRWAHNDTVILVWFDDGGRARAKSLQIVRNGDILERIRYWIDPPRTDWVFEAEPSF